MDLFQPSGLIAKKKKNRCKQDRCAYLQHAVMKDKMFLFEGKIVVKQDASVLELQDLGLDYDRHIRLWYVSWLPHHVIVGFLDVLGFPSTVKTSFYCYYCPLCVAKKKSPPGFSLANTSTRHHFHTWTGQTLTPSRIFGMFSVEGFAHWSDSPIHHQYKILVKHERNRGRK